MVAPNDTIWSTWQQVAESLGGQFAVGLPHDRESTKELHPGEPSIVVTIDGQRVVVLADEYNWGTGTFQRTRLSCLAKGAVDLFLVITQGTEHNTLDEGALDVFEADDEGLRERFLIKANDEELARLWLCPETQRLVLGTYDDSTEFGYRFEINWENVTIRRFGLERDGQRLEHAIRAAAALGRQGIDIMHRCRDLAQALGGTLSSRATEWYPDGSVTIRVGEYSGEVTIDHRSQSFGHSKQTLVTQVSTARTSSVKDRFLIARPHLAAWLLEQAGFDMEERRVSAGGLSDEYWIGGEELAPLSRRLDRQHQRALLRLAPAAVLGKDGRLSIWLTGFVDDVERLRTAIELVEALSADLAGSPSSGPYR